jgi:putative sigma-54 modulation protein
VNLRIAARHFDITDDVKQYAEKKLITLKRFYENIIDVDLVLTSEKYRYIGRGHLSP